MIPEDKISEFVTRMREAARNNLECIILYGSAASGDFQPVFSNLNMFCVLRESSFASLQALSSTARWWDRQKQPPPLFMTRSELESSSDVFSIELMDMQQHHRVLFGEDPLQGLQVSAQLHRTQVEYELREKLILLRQQLLLTSGNDRRTWEVLVHSVPSFATLFRHVLIALGHDSGAGKREPVKALSQHVGFDASSLHQILDVREHHVKAKTIDTQDLCTRYLAAIEQVIAAVDKRIGPDAS